MPKVLQDSGFRIKVFRRGNPNAKILATVRLDYTDGNSKSALVNLASEEGIRDLAVMLGQLLERPGGVEQFQVIPREEE